MPNSYEKEFPKRIQAELRCAAGETLRETIDAYGMRQAQYHGKREVFIEEKGRQENKAEQEADRFAQELLLPSGAYKAFIVGGRFDNASVVSGA